MYLSQRCDWQKHIDFIKEKAWSGINLLRMLKFTINRKSLETIYFAYIRSLLEYADVLWDNCTQQQCYEIEKSNLKLDVLSLVQQYLLKLTNSTKSLAG